jgi:hypothetical protein
LEDYHGDKIVDRMTASQASRSEIGAPRAGMFLPVALSVLISFTAVGCSGSASLIERKAIYGKIVGAEGQNGLVTFTPVDTSIGPAAMNDFEAGAYRFTKESGPVPGKYNVSIELEESISQADMPRNLSGSRPPTVMYEAVEKTITASVPAEGPFEINIDITN